MSQLPIKLLILAVGLAGIASIPTTLIGGIEAASMMVIGAGLGLVTVLGGYFCTEYVFRGPNRFAVTFVVGGFVIRIALLVLLLTVVILTTNLDPSRFLLWMVAFYFALVVAEAWLLMRENILPEGNTSQ